MYLFCPMSEQAVDCNLQVWDLQREAYFSAYASAHLDIVHRLSLLLVEYFQSSLTQIQHQGATLVRRPNLRRLESEIGGR